MSQPVPVPPVVSLAGADAGRRVDSALRHCGFMYVSDHGIPAETIERAFAASRAFFARPDSAKNAVSYTSVDANFGFQGVASEHLDPTAAADLKEAFTMRNPRAAEQWPDPGFQTEVLNFFDAAMAAAQRLLRTFADVLDVPQEFFNERHLGENVTLRLLHYPTGLEQCDASQNGAGAHTDYGSITLLFQDDIPGLELRGPDDDWIAAPRIPGTVTVNTGDLMQHWTNGRFRSTLHRVRPVTGARDRYSIALFVDPDDATRVECLPSCVSAATPARFEPTTAGEHIRRRLAAAQAEARSTGT